MRKNCCTSTEAPLRESTDVDVALVGNPNSGKTTLFNSLTGLRQKVGNYPGVTVEKKTGVLSTKDGRSVRLHDLPGLYSLVPKSLDDKIAADAITGHSEYLRQLKLIVVVADASNLSRSLYLVTQTAELGIPVLLALNMMDAAEANGVRIDIAELGRQLDIEVLPVVARKGRGVEALRKRIFELIEQQTAPDKVVSLPVEETVTQAAQPIGEWLCRTHGINCHTGLAEAYRVLSNDKALQSWTSRNNGNGKELRTLVEEARAKLSAQEIAWHMLETNHRYRWVDTICQKTVSSNGKHERTVSEKLDSVLTHKVAGPLLFLILLAIIFQAVFSWAQIPMDAIDSGITWIGGQVAALMPDGILQDLIVDGAISGVGAVLAFMPQILFLFFFLSLLEGSGYMSRAAFILDRFMRVAGLSGRSVIPLLSSFACAVPGIMATRTIQNTRDRLVTIMVAPLMSCSARLPVYALMIGAFIPGRRVFWIFTLPGLTLLSMYLIGILAASGAALVLNKVTEKQQGHSNFVMELPPYRLPSLKWSLLQMWERAKIFLTNAGKIIFAMSVVLWALAYFPRPATHAAGPGENAITQSYASRLGHAMEPAIKPLGFDWKIGIGLITSFAAREVMVSTMATIYNVEDDGASSVNLREALKNDRDPRTGKPVYTPLTAIALMVFFVLACQCMSTLAVVRRETNSWRWPVIMLLYMTTLAYIGAFVVFQGGTFLGLG